MGKTFASRFLKHRALARPGQRTRCQSRADRFVYLRAAQAYMLISMPTGSSTIFGVFQLIGVSQVVWHDIRAKFEPMSGADATQVRWIDVEGRCVAPTVDTSLLDNSISLLD
jgi:hypothetical protein